MSNPTDPLDPMAFLNNAIAHAHAQNELLAANARIRQLEAEVQRLTKAGDGLQKSMLEIGCNEMADNFEHDAWWASYYGWNAAKDGNANG